MQVKRIIFLLSMFLGAAPAWALTLEETGGNRSEAARRLQITRKTLLNKLKSYNIN